MPAKKRKVTSSRTRSTRTASKRPTSSKTRATRSKASTNSSRVTSSGQKSGTGAKRVTSGRGVTKSPGNVTGRGAQGPRNPPVQGPSRKTPTAMGGPQGRKPRAQPPRPQARGDRFPSSTARKIKTASRVARGASLLSKLGSVGKGLVGLAATEAAFPARAADGTLKGKISRPNTQKLKAKPKPKAKPKKTLSAGAKSFDRAFAAARRSGKKEFTWRGKRYNTKLA